MTIRVARSGKQFTVSCEGLQDACTIRLPQGTYTCQDAGAQQLEANVWQLTASTEQITFVQA